MGFGEMGLNQTDVAKASTTVSTASGIQRACLTFILCDDIDDVLLISSP